MIIFWRKNFMCTHQRSYYTTNLCTVLFLGLLECIKCRYRNDAWLTHDAWLAGKKRKIKRKERKKKTEKVYGTHYSQAVTHWSTDWARRCLTSVIGREPVFSTWYGRRRSIWWGIFFYPLRSPVGHFKFSSCVHIHLSVSSTRIDFSFA